MADAPPTRGKGEGEDARVPKLARDDDRECGDDGLNEGSAGPGEPNEAAWKENESGNPLKSGGLVGNSGNRGASILEKRSGRRLYKTVLEEPGLMDTEHRTIKENVWRLPRKSLKY